MSADISFSSDVATVSIDGEMNVWLGWFGIAAMAVAAALCIKVDLLLFTVFGWLLVAVLPFAIYEFLRIAPNLSYQISVHRAGQAVVRTNRSQGNVRCKTGEFLDVQVLSAVTPGEYSVTIYYVQLRCAMGIVWVDAHRSAKSAHQLAASLAQWLDVELKAPAKTSYISAVTSKQLLPRYNPWKQLG